MSLQYLFVIRKLERHKTITPNSGRPKSINGVGGASKRESYSTTAKDGNDYTGLQKRYTCMV